MLEGGDKVWYPHSQRQPPAEGRAERLVGQKSQVSTSFRYIHSRLTNYSPDIQLTLRFATSAALTMQSPIVNRRVLPATFIIMRERKEGHTCLFFSSYSCRCFDHNVQATKSTLIVRYLIISVQ